MGVVIHVVDGRITHFGGRVQMLSPNLGCLHSKLRSCGVDVKIADANGNELPRDGVSSGRFMLRGP
ncbi:hypothetical protein [Bradyrhizobium sp. McL0616]|uniref:hypothetical protein n=1 Tax=Bradyrhizobium sp. McL0616 TaxID=3415674 RepID=UPI003CFA6EB7